MAILHGRVSCSTLMMAQTITLLYIVVLCITLRGENCNAQPTAYSCNVGFNYTAGSAFESNLNTVLNSLVQDTSQTGFNTSVYGQSPDQIYGLLQCRGDTTAQQCYSCSQEANTTIRQNCGNAGGGLIWFDLCFLRYGNYSFIGQLDIMDGWYLHNAQNVSSPDVFHQALVNLFTQLSDKATSGSKFYASETYIDSLLRIPKIYGLVQCTRDISSDDCRTCLLQTISTVFVYYSETQGARGLMGSCIVRYEIYPFLNYTVLPPTPAEAPITQPQFPFTSTNRVNITCNHTVNYTEGSMLESNLNVFFNLLTTLVSLNRYSTFSYGESPDRIYGSILYRMSAINSEISSCLRKVNDTLRRNCTNAVGGTILLDVCSFGYANYDFTNLQAPAPSNSVAYTPPKRIRPPAPAPSNTVAYTPPKRIRPPKKIPIILGVGGGLLVSLLVCLCATWRRLKTAIFPRGYKADEEETAIRWEDTSILNEDRQIVFKMDSLVAATKNFHHDNKLGEGGFGPVYKGITEDGKEIAVKKLALNSIQGKKEFLNEVKLVAKIHHRNLVKLLGYCTESSEMSLVYEYLPNKSLDKVLFDIDPKKRKNLDWETRYNIIVGVARGLLYLHQDCQLRIIHRDIKASNILLDEKLNPKIADFGLAKHFPEDKSHVSTRVAGTFGYMAPEYVMQGQLSAKADVYSFGVLLLELITGRKNTDHTLSPEMQILLGWAWRSYHGGNILQIIDPSIIETCNEKQVLRCIHVGLLCTQVESSFRPPMSTVTLMLSTDSLTLPDPTKPFFVSSGESGSSHVPRPQLPPDFLSKANSFITDLAPR